MAMTKKEKAEFEKALMQANKLAALRWTDGAVADVPLPDCFNTESKGWAYVASISYGTDRVEQAWSSSCSHGTGTSRSSGAQGGVKLFSTELLALKALRHVVENECAARLYRIDKMIEKALGDGT